MAEEEAVALREDLLAKLDLLQQWTEIPELKINEYFNEIRNEVDTAFELLLVDANNEKAAKINEIRVEMIKKIEVYEKLFVEKIELGRDDPNQIKIIANSTKRIEHIRQKSEELGVFIQADQEDQNCDKLGDIEDQYERIFLEILKETYKLEKRLLDGQSIFFVPNKKDHDKNLFGLLVHLENDHLNKDEIKCLKILIKAQDTGFDDASTNFILVANQMVLNSMNESSRVFIRKPNCITNGILLIRYLFPLIRQQILANTEFLLLVNKDSVNTLQFFSNDQPKDSLNCRGVEMWNASVEAIEGDQNLFKYFKLKKDITLDLSCNNMRYFNLKPCEFIQRLNGLNLNSNWLATFNEESLLAFKHVQELRLIDAFKHGVKFSLEFLRFFKNLNLLELSLPRNAPLDFSVFKELTFLSSLNLEATRAGDAGENRIKLTTEFFENFVSRLGLFSLHGFELETIEPFMLGQLKMNNHVRTAVTLELVNCKVANLSDNSFHFPDATAVDAINLARNFIKLFNKSAFMGNQRLRDLVLQDNYITDLPDGALEFLPGLTKLDLARNLLVTVKEKWFAGHPSLMTLIFEDNPIETIEDKAFANISKLSHLNLAGCKLKLIDSMMFKDSTVTDLDLSRNRIESIVVRLENRRPIHMSKVNLDKKELEYVREAFFSGRRLRSLNLSHNKLKKLDFNSFQHIDHLERLDISHNLIRELNRVTYDPKWYILRSLNLENNQLKSISKHIFGPSNALAYFNLANNELEQLDSEFFRPFTYLNFLNLENNKLSMEIDDQTFVRPMYTGYRLTQLCLSRNASIVINKSAQAHASQIKTLKISYFKNMAQTLEELQLEKLSSLSINHIDQTTLDDFLDYAIPHQVSQLDFSFGSITSLERFSLTLEFYRFNQLNLSHNQLSTLKSDWFKKMTNLRQLDLSNNLIETLGERGMFRTLYFIESINLSGNRLSVIHVKTFEGLTYLKMLDLSKNKDLTKLADNQFRDLVRLTEVNLSGNNMDHLNVARVFKRCHYLIKLDLSSNKLDDRSFGVSSFAELQLKHTLSELNLADNQVESISFVGHLVNLTRLDLSNNRLKSLKDEKGQNCLSKLMSLRHLALSGNQVKSIEAGTLDHLTWTLEHLDVSKNQGIKIENQELSKNVKLNLIR